MWIVYISDQLEASVSLESLPPSSKILNYSQVMVLLDSFNYFLDY